LLPDLTIHRATVRVAFFALFLSLAELMDAASLGWPCGVQPNR